MARDMARDNGAGQPARGEQGGDVWRPDGGPRRQADGAGVPGARPQMPPPHEVRAVPGAQAIPGPTAYRAGFLATADLSVDPKYQRPLEEARARRYARKWNETLAQALVCVRRPDGRMVVVDGQHRLAAARMAGIPFVMCHVLSQAPSPAEEARLFGDLSIERKALTVGDRFRVALEGQDPVSVGVQEVTLACGYELGLGPVPRKSIQGRQKNVISALGALLRIYGGGGTDAASLQFDPRARTYPERLRRVLTTIRRAWPDNPEALAYTCLMGMDTFLATYGGEIDLEQAIERLAAADPAALRRKAAFAKEQMGGGTQHHMAQLMLDTYNYKRSSRRVKSKFFQGQE